MISVRRARAALPAALLVAAMLISLVATTLTASPTDAQEVPPCDCPSGPDFNGDGYDDLAVGAPKEDIGAVVDSGAVTIMYGSATGIQPAGAVLFHQDSPDVPGVAEENDRWSDTLTTGDINGDGYDDVIIGAPLEDIGATDSAGAVTVMYGSPQGITAAGSQIIWQGTGGIPGIPEANDKFGGAITAADFNNDGYDDLAVGAHQEGIGPVNNTGAVIIINGSADGLDTDFNVLLHQDAPEVPGVNEGSDFWGQVLSSGDVDNDGYDDLVVGAPNEDIGSLREGGAITILYGSDDGVVGFGSIHWAEQNSSVPGLSQRNSKWGLSLAVGDLDGDGHDDIAVGAEFTDFDELFDAGAVTVLYGGAQGITSGQLLFEDFESMGDGDRWGSDLGIADVDGDGVQDLLVYAYGEDIDFADQGAVSVIHGSPQGLGDAIDQTLHEGTEGMAGRAEVGDRWGRIAVGDFDNDGYADLAAGATSEDVGDIGGAGAVTMVYGTANGLDTADSMQLWQGYPGMPGLDEAGDNFGSV